MGFNFKGYNLVDYVKILANVLTAFGAGYAQGGYVGGAVAIAAVLVGLYQSPPAHTAYPN